MDSDWLEHWINDLISNETISKYDFSDWMWCHERYTVGDIMLMRYYWELRKFSWV